MPFTDLQTFLFGSSSPAPESQSGCAVLKEEDVAISQQTRNATSLELYGQQQVDANYQPPNMLPVSTGILNQAPQLEFVGHNIVCAPNQYYGGMMPLYGPPLIPPQFVDVRTRIPLAPETGPHPVFVNAKQYNAILRRRKSRAKAEAKKKLIKARKPYLHGRATNTQ